MSYNLESITEQYRINGSFHDAEIIAKKIIGDKNSGSGCKCWEQELLQSEGDGTCTLIITNTKKRPKKKSEYPRLRRHCPQYGCGGQQYLRTREKGKTGTWRCPRCGRIDKANLDDSKVRKFLNL